MKVNFFSQPYLLFLYSIKDPIRKIQTGKIKYGGREGQDEVILAHKLRRAQKEFYEYEAMCKPEVHT